MSEYIVNETGYPGTIKQEIVGELVRCKDCKHASICDGGVLMATTVYGVFAQQPVDYCSYGERKERSMNE